MENLWWGYLHTNGHLQAKRYFSREDLDEAGERPFVEKYFGPFEAKDRDQALEILTQKLI